MALIAGRIDAECGNWNHFYVFMRRRWHVCARAQPQQKLEELLSRDTSSNDHHPDDAVVQFGRRRDHALGRNVRRIAGVHHHEFTRFRCPRVWHRCGERWQRRGRPVHLHRIIEVIHFAIAAGNLIVDTLIVAFIGREVGALPRIRRIPCVRTRTIRARIDAVRFERQHIGEGIVAHLAVALAIAIGAIERRVVAHAVL